MPAFIGFNDNCQYHYILAVCLCLVFQVVISLPFCRQIGQFWLSVWPAFTTVSFKRFASCIFFYFAHLIVTMLRQRFPICRRRGTKVFSDLLYNCSVGSSVSDLHLFVGFRCLIKGNNHLLLGIMSILLDLFISIYPKLIIVVND